LAYCVHHEFGGLRISKNHVLAEDAAGISYLMEWRREY
jgi:hypothetical protein